jgi:hypothetical protein
MKKNVKKILAVGLGGVVLLGLGGFAGSQIFPKEVVVTRTVTEVQTIEDTARVDILTAQVTDLQAQLDVKPDVITEVKEVQSKDLPLVLEHIFNNGGNIDYITQDLDDDEIGLIVDRIILVDDFKKLSVQSIEKDLFDKLDGEIVDGTELDNKDMEKLRINDGADEIIIDDIDFQDNDATLIVSGSFKQDDVKFLFDAEVIFRDGEYDELGSIVVTKE